MASKIARVLALLLASAPIYAATPGAISGFIKDAAGTPQMGAVVEISASSATLGTTVFTDSKGFYAARDLPVGVYQVKVSAVSFLPSLRQNVNLKAGARLVVNLTLNTLADAINLIPDSRSPKADPDEWHWTLRSDANRPILRVVDNGPAVVVGSDSGEDHVLKGQVAFLSGSDADGFGSAGGDVTTAFSLEKPMFTSGTLSFNGDLSGSSGEPIGVLHASYAHDFGTGSQPTVTVTYRHLASPGLAFQNASYADVTATASDTTSVTRFIDVNYGTQLEELQLARRVGEVRPFGSVDVHLSPNTLLEYRYATSEPGSVNDKEFAAAAADFSDPTPRMAVSGGEPNLERARHQELSVSHRFGKSSLQVAYYTDQIRNTVLTGAGDPSDYADDVLPDFYSDTFSYNGGALSTAGMRVVAQRRFGDDVTATLDYATGGVLTLRAPLSNWESLAANLGSERQQSVSAKISGKIPSCKTQLIASYKWNGGNALTGVDEFNASPGQTDPYLSLFIRQPLPAVSFMPGRIVALLDVRNLLAQGYLPVLGQDGHTLYLVQSARALRGGLAFTF